MRAVAFYKNHDHGLPHVSHDDPDPAPVNSPTTFPALRRVWARLSATCSRLLVARLAAKCARLLSAAGVWVAALPFRLRRSACSLLASRAKEQGNSCCPTARYPSAMNPPEPPPCHPDAPSPNHPRRRKPRSLHAAQASTATACASPPLASSSSRCVGTGEQAEGAARRRAGAFDRMLWPRAMARPWASAGCRATSSMVSPFGRRGRLRMLALCGQRASRDSRACRSSVAGGVRPGVKAARHGTPRMGLCRRLGHATFGRPGQALRPREDAPTATRCTYRHTTPIALASTGARLLVDGGRWVASLPSRLRAAAADLRAARPEETGLGVCPSALGNSASFVVHRPLPRRPSTPRQPAQQQLDATALTSHATSAFVPGPTANPLHTLARAVSRLRAPPPSDCIILNASAIPEPTAPPPAAPRPAQPPAAPPPARPPPVSVASAPPSPQQLDAIRELVEVMTVFSGPPPPSVTVAVALAFGFKRPQRSTHKAIAAAAHLALHPSLTVRQTPPQLRSSARSMSAWRVRLSSALRHVIEERRRPPSHSAASLRAETEEERGEGVAASAYCTSASHALQPAVASWRVLVLFSGPYARQDGLAAFLEARGYEVTQVDNDSSHGSADDDFLNDAFFERLLRRVESGYYCCVFAAPPCSTFSVSRHYRAKSKRRRDSGPPPVRLRPCPAGVVPPPAGHARELEVANRIVDRLCTLLLAAVKAGADYCIENPADRGDRSSQHTFLFPDHAPLWLYPSIVRLRLQTHGRLCTFAQCQFPPSVPWQKYTTYLYSPRLAPFLDPWNSLVCHHSSHAETAGGQQDADGVWSSRKAAAYPAAMNEATAEAIHRAHAAAVAAAAAAASATASSAPVTTHPSKVGSSGSRPSPPPPAVKRPRDPPAHDPASFAYVLPVSVGRRVLACVPAGGGLFRVRTEGEHSAARQSATAAAADLVPHLTDGVSADAVFLAGQLRGTNIAVGACCVPQDSLDVCTSRAQVLARSLEHGAMSPTWCTLDAIAEDLGTDSDVECNAEREHTYFAAASAIARTLSHASPAHGAHINGMEIGAGAGGTVSRNSVEAALPADFRARYDRAVAADAELHDALLSAAAACADSSLAATYTAWSERFSPPPLDEIPPGLRAQARDFSTCHHLAVAPFVQRCAVPSTSPLPPPAAQLPCDDGWQPESLSDVLTPNAIKRIRAALQKIQDWHAAKRAGLDAPRPPPLALGISAFQPRARHRVWDLRDCRADGSGKPKLLDTTSPPFQTHLNVDYLEQLFADVADRELVSMLRFGVCVHAELPPQIVIFPNLLSLYDGESGIHEAARTVSELSQLGWWQQHDFIPFAPWRCAPRGAVPRKDGGAARGIVDQGAPRNELFTRPEYEPVVSLNDACRAGRERVELKPHFSDLAHNASVLLHIADTIGEPVFAIAFDFSKYFHQMLFRSDELWRMGSLLPMAGDDGLAAELLSIHTEMVMSMGMTPSSEIAQRLGNALMQVFAMKLRAAEAEQGWQPSDAERRWREQRELLPHDALGSAARMFDAMQYTDDPCFLVVGVQRALLAIRTWHEIIAGSGLQPAKFSKWQIGSSVQWLGGRCSPSLGVMWVPRDKAMRARERIQTVLDGTCTPKEYQGIVGFLEHVVDIGRFPRELMQYLHHPMRSGGECETDPHGTLPPDSRRDGYLRKWRSLLLNTPGASLLAANKQLPLDRTALAVWRLRSDAMLETFDSAMGGCLYGAWWRFSLRRPQLTIPVLELLAACVNFIVFADRLSAARHVVMEIDALAAPTVLHKDKARAPGLRAVLAEFRRLPQLQSFTCDNRLFCEHCWGEGNPLGDAASRGKRDVLHAIGSALGMQMRQQPIGAEALAFIDRVLARLDAQPLTVAEREFDSTLGYPGEGPPSAPTPSPRSALSIPASASPALISFLDAADSADPLQPQRLPSSPSALPFASSPPPAPFPFAAASPSPLPAAASSSSPPPPACGPSPVSTGPQSPRSLGLHRASASDPQPIAFASASSIADAIATGEPWCASLLPEPPAAWAAEAAHLRFAAAQCAHAAAERVAPSLLLQFADPSLPLPHPASFVTSTSSSAPPPPRSASFSSSLSHAAAARARALSAALTSDSAAGGIRLDDGEADWLSSRLVQLLEAAAASNTLRGERSNWKHWMAFCTHRNVNPFRDDVRGMDHAAYDKEVVTLALALLFIYGRMNCRKGRRHPPKPSSALAVLRGIRRAHARLGVQMADLSLATRLADSLNREYIDAHGWEALQVDRVAPLTNSLIEGMLQSPPVAGHDVGAVSGRALWATMAQTGFRKAEVALGREAIFGPSCLTRHNLRWRIAGQELADPSAEQLRGMQAGDMAILIPPKSKCDQFGLEWGQAPIYLRFHPRAPICAARALRDLELALPRNGLAQREATALFVRRDASPLTCGDVDSLFKLCLQRSGVQRAATARYSPHSFRRYLACALKAQGASDSTIQALLRWKTPESLKLYSILNDERYADLVDSAGSADVSSVRTNALPRAEMLEAAGRFEQARTQLTAEAHVAANTKPEDDEVHCCSDDCCSSSDDDAVQQRGTSRAKQPAPPRRKRQRSAGAASSSEPSPPPPLDFGSAVGRRALVPASVWPGETCLEHNGRGWEVVVDQVDRRAGAVLVGFSTARDSRGKRYAREWLRLESLVPL